MHISSHVSAGLLSLVGLCLCVALLSIAPATQAGSQPDQPSPSCVVETTKSALPESLLLGELVTVTLHTKATCPADDCPLRIVLVIEGSSHVSGGPIDSMKAAAVEFVRNLDLQLHPDRRVGVVEFNDQARTLSQLTNAEGTVVGAILHVGSSGGVRTDLGIKEGTKTLIRGRSTADTCTTRVMIVLSHSASDSSCEEVLSAARVAKGQGILVVTICFDGTCDAACMRQAATSPPWFYQVQDIGGLNMALRQIKDRITDVALIRLTVFDELPENMQYVPDSASPPPTNIDPSGKTVRWDAEFVTSFGITHTLLVEPLEPGHFPTNIRAEATYKDGVGWDGSQRYPVPWVTVLKASPGRTPPPADTPQPSATPEPPTATPTPKSAPVYLPITKNEVL